MKRWIVFTLLIGLAACAGEPTSPDMADTPDLTLQADQHTGNGFPQGAHDYKLNIIGVPHDKTAEMDDNNGRRIFVQLNGGQTVCVDDADWAAYLDLIGAAFEENPYHCDDDTGALKGGRGKVTGGWDGLDKVNKILLTPNTDDVFQVLDANATDSDGAEFTMPDDVYTGYKVYARALGTPGGKAAMTLCANETDVTSDLNGTETWCSINQMVMERTRGPSKAEDVTDVLFTLTILVDIDDAKDYALTACLGSAGLIDLGDTDLQVADVPIFHSCFEDYFWNYDNNGLKLLELRFYQVPVA